jgi:hypothetical protein
MAATFLAWEFEPPFKSCNNFPATSRFRLQLNVATRIVSGGCPCNNFLEPSRRRNWTRESSETRQNSYESGYGRKFFSGILYSAESGPVPSRIV